LKKWLPYFIGAAALLVLVVLAVYTPFKRERKLDERITLRQRDKIPYGMYVAEHLVDRTFSNAHVSVEKSAPGFWSGVNPDTSNQVVFLTSKAFDPEAEELQHLMRFVQQGNYLFIITENIGWDAEQSLGLNTARTFAIREDSLQVALNIPFVQPGLYAYPGKREDSYFTKLDSNTAVPLGTNSEGRTNFVALQSGRGKLFIHLAPLAFSNYFLLHKSNIRYLENVLSLLPQALTILFGMNIT
jgi:hypothetical protein